MYTNSMTRCGVGVVALACILCVHLWNVGVGESERSAIGENAFALQQHQQLRRNLNINKTVKSVLADNATHAATSTSIYYHTLTSKELGHVNPDVTLGNPLKGFVPSPDYSKPPYLTPVPHSLEFYYIGLKQVMIDNPDVVGATAAFNWTAVEKILNATASRAAHAVLRFYVVYPGRDLEVPLYLLKQPGGIVLRNYTEDGYINQQSPYFGDAPLRRCLELFIRNLAKKYDGHKRIGYLQAGLAGFWGEWHSMGKGFFPDFAGVEIEKWFAQSFFKTEVQFRYPSATLDRRFGLHDDSFAYETLDGPANGGVVRHFYFWPRAIKQNMTDVWKHAPVGGETRIELAHEIFTDTYQSGTFRKQDFMLAVNTTHATYMFQHSVFSKGGFTGSTLTRVKAAHARMGYNFYVPTVAVKISALGVNLVDVDVTLMQIGVAPFYYDLNLTLQCPGMPRQSLRGADGLEDAGESKVFAFVQVPATSYCLRALSLQLDSSYLFPARPIKFAQGNGTLVFKLPMPANLTHAPTMAPSVAPTRAPVTFAPTAPESLATRLTLINADSDLDIGRLTNGLVVNLTLTPRINARADPAPSFPTRSVEFKYDGVRIRVDNGEPYAFQKNTGSDYSPWTPGLGVHTIIATPFSGADATGREGTPVRISFTVVGMPPVPSSKPVPMATRAPVTPPTTGKASAPSAAPITTSPEVTKLTLINADTDLDIGPLTTGMTINLYHHSSLNVRADPPSSFLTRSVQFKYDGVIVRTDSGDPYALARNVGTNYSSWTPTLGSHVIIATPYVNADANGTAGPWGRVAFSVVNIPPPTAPKSPVPVPAPVPPKTLAPVVPPYTKLTLVNADTDLDIGPLTTGMIINLHQYPSLNVRADPPSSFIARSVQFKFDGIVGRTDNGEPYAFARNLGSNYTSWATPTLGVHTITATPYTMADANGTAGPLANVTFTVIKTAPPSAATRAPIVVPSRAPTRAPIVPPTAAPTFKPTLPMLTQLTLINADTDLDVGPLTTGMIINLHQLPSLNVRADPPLNFIARSVQFKYDGVAGRIDNGEPYALARNVGMNYSSWTPTVGVHTITATPFTAPDANGTAGPVANVTFTVVKIAPVPPTTRTPVAVSPAPVTVAPSTRAPIVKPTPTPVLPMTLQPYMAPTAAPTRAPVSAVTRVPTLAPATTKPSAAPRLSIPPPPPPPPLSAATTVTQLTLVNADTDFDIGPLTTGMVINLAHCSALNVRADPPATFGTRSVQFIYNSASGSGSAQANFIRLDNAAPYALQRNAGTNYTSWTPALGNHTIVATPYTLPSANGTAGPSSGIVWFTVVNVSISVSTTAAVKNGPR